MKTIPPFQLADCSVPGTASLTLPDGICWFFGSHRAHTLQVHLQPTNNGYETLPLSESARLIINYIQSQATWICIQAHSGGARFLMHACLQAPDILEKIARLRLINPPPYQTVLSNQFANNSDLGWALKRKFPNIHFTPWYIESLLSDNLDIYIRFLALISQRSNIEAEIWSTPLDKIVLWACWLRWDSFPTGLVDPDSYMTASNIHLFHHFFWHNFEYKSSALNSDDKK